MRKALALVLRDPDEDMRVSARRQAIEDEARNITARPGYAAFVQPFDLEATRRRILGLPPEPPMAGWRW